MSLSHRGRVGLYLAAVLAVTVIHQPAVLLGLLAGFALLSGKGRMALALRAARPVAWILLLVSAGYLLTGWLTGQDVLATLALINLRVLAIAVLTAWMVRDTDLDRALAGWPTARRWLVVVRGQTLLFRRLLLDYRQAQRSRASMPPTLRQRYLGSAAIGLAALDKGVHNAEMVTQAMRSRGALHE